MTVNYCRKDSVIELLNHQYDEESSNADLNACGHSGFSTKTYLSILILAIIFVCIILLLISITRDQHANCGLFSQGYHCHRRS